MILQKSAEFKIHLNVKDDFGRTAFHRASQYGTLKTVGIMIDNSVLFGLDLTLKDNNGKTGFQLAEQHQQTEVIDLINKKMPSIVV